MGGCLAGFRRGGTVHVCRADVLDDISPGSVPAPDPRSIIKDKNRKSAERSVTSGFIGRFRTASSIGASVVQDMGSQASRGRTGNILSFWGRRGAQHHISDFYTFAAKLGSGAYSTVEKWKFKVADDEPGEDDDMDNFVAVKILRWSLISGGICRDPEKEQEIRNELRMLLALDNPFVVRFREWFEHPCRGICFVTEICEGRSFQRYLEEICEIPSREERLTRKAETRRCFREIVYAVSYIHNSTPKVVHRDLKPDNVLFKNNQPGSPIKLIDFGLAVLKESRDATKNAVPVGTMVFMAPELFLHQGASEIHEEVDLWAVGLILGWCISALHLGSLQHPMIDIEECNAFEVSYIELYNAYRQKVPLNKKIFEGWEDDRPFEDSAEAVISALMQHDPEKRRPACEVLQMGWVRAQDPAVSASAAILRKEGVLLNLQTYNDLDNLDKKILSLVADHGCHGEITQLRRTFRALDTNGDGMLSFEEVAEGFEKNDVQVPPEVAESLFTDGDGLMNYNEWLAATIGKKMLTSHVATRAVFRQLDASGTGAISFQDLSEAIGSEEATRVLGNRTELNYKEFEELVDIVAEHRQAVCRSMQKGNDWMSRRDGSMMLF